MSDVTTGQVDPLILSIPLPTFVHTRVQRIHRDYLKYPTDLPTTQVIVDALGFQSEIEMDLCYGVVVLGPENEFQGGVFERYGSAQIDLPANDGYSKSDIRMQFQVQDVSALQEQKPDDVIRYYQCLIMSAIDLFWVCARHYASGRLPVVIDTDSGKAIFCFEAWLDQRYA